MSGPHVMAYSACAGCRRPIAYNPHFVPSIRIDGVREPVCQACVDVRNAHRKAKGLPPDVIDPRAYEPLPESEL